MKFRLILNDSEIVDGPTPEAVVEKLARLSWPDVGALGGHGKAKTPQLYMIEVSERVKEQKQIAVQTCCAAHFLEDLERAGAVERI